MRNIFFLFLLLLSGASTFSQTTLFEDDASNYITWSDASNEGTGFGPWVLITETPNGGFAGHFLSSSTPTHGDINTGGQAFGMFANPIFEGPVSKAQRSLSYTPDMTTFAELQDGHTFSVELAINFRNGNKGIDLFTSDFTQIFNFNVGNDDYQQNGQSLGWAYSATSVITLELTQISSTEIQVKLTRGSDIFNSGIISVAGRLAVFETYIVGTEGAPENNLYFNSPSIRTTNPLPVEWGNIEANARGNEILLYWETLSEVENDYFLIERSIDGRTFSAQGQVNSNSNLNGPRAYTHLDREPESGINYYRIKQVDFDGSVSVSDVVSASVSKPEFGYLPYPNPVSGLLNIPEPSLLEMQLIDFLGKSVLRIPPNTNQIDVSAIDAGIYILKGQNTQQTIVKE